MMALVLGAVVLFIGIYTVVEVVNSITFPTTTRAESLVFVNITAKAVTYPNINVLSSVANTTDSIPISPVGATSTCYASSATAITCQFNETYAAGTYTATYTSNPRTGNVTYGTTQTTFWNSMQLAGVSLITVAASLIIGSFFFK